MACLDGGSSPPISTNFLTMKNFFKSLILAAILLFTGSIILAQEIAYQEPAQSIKDLALSKPLPEVTFSNNFNKAVITKRDNPFSDLSYIKSQEYRVGGLRFNENHSNSRQNFSNSISLLDVYTSKESPILDLPSKLQISEVKWSNSGNYFYFLNNLDNEVELWEVNSADLKAKKINIYPINSIIGGSYFVLGDRSVVYKSVVSHELISKISEDKLVGPIAQEQLGNGKSARTLPDLIKSREDEQIFENYTTSQLVLYKSGESHKIGDSKIFRSIRFSPDKEYILLTTIEKPFSYSRIHLSFPYKTEIWDLTGKILKTLEVNKEGNLSIRGDEDTTSTPKPKIRESNFRWREDTGSTLIWNESLIQTKKDTTDKKPRENFIYQQNAPFNSPKELLIKREGSIENLQFSNGSIAFFATTLTKEKIRNQYVFYPADTSIAPKLIYSESREVDTTGNFPVFGKYYTINNSFGEDVVYTDSKSSFIYLTDTKRRDLQGDQFSFLDKLTISDLKIQNVWSASAPFLDALVYIKTDKKTYLLIKRESPIDVPNYHLIDLKGKSLAKITNFENPYPSILKLKREFVEYKRADGLKLTAVLYLPENYDVSKDGKLPVFMWGYPYEFKSFAEAEKRRAQRYSFPRPGYASPIFWATRGYAVLDDYAQPIIAKVKSGESNDTFIEQLVKNAEAAINYIDSIGVGDKNRVAVGGHSYGAFMTANLLAHSKLFRAGIARSGAYNRSLTPFGFQSEQRTYWKAQQLYNDMSPFNYADKIKTPILLIHGQLDNNQGTFPIQSERMFHAISGLGGVVRYVQLPFESHRYSAKESVLHVLYETDSWLEKYVKNARIENKSEK